MNGVYVTAVIGAAFIATGALGAWRAYIALDPELAYASAGLVAIGLVTGLFAVAGYILFS